MTMITDHDDYDKGWWSSTHPSLLGRQPIAPAINADAAAAPQQGLRGTSCAAPPVKSLYYIPTHNPRPNALLPGASEGENEPVAPTTTLVLA